MTTHYTAYIDEAGDEGFGKLRVGGPTGQSTWLIIGAMVVGPVNNAGLAKSRDAIMAKFPNKKRPDLHFRTLTHEQKVVVSKDLSELNVGLSLTFSHKTTIPGSPYEVTFKRKGYLYNYLVRWLLERLIPACKTRAPNGAVLHLVFSRRAGTDYESMKSYLRMLASDGDLIKAPRKTDWSVLDIDGIEVENHSKRAGLQLSDCATSAFFAAVEPDFYGNYEQRYALLLKDRLITAAGTPLNSGLTVVPSIGAARCDEDQRRFFRACCEGGQAPGS